MKLETASDFEGSVPEGRIKFGFSANNAKLFGFLSDGIYRDKVMAVIREISCNAQDAHTVAGTDKPFLVHVPSSMDPTLTIEDYGTGLPPDKIGEIFWTYGDSTKTNDDRQIGALGLGSKSPFAYTKSSFVVKNRYAGKEYIYLCFINEQGTPDGSLTSAEPTDKPNGVTVELAVRSDDVYAFQNRIARFFKHWENRPTFAGAAITIPEVVKTFEGTNWYLEKEDAYGARPTAIMGGVAYPILLDSIPNASPALKFVCSNNFVLTFPIGSLRFQISREELSYEKITIDALEAAAGAIAKDIRANIKAQIEAEAITPYDLWVAYKTRTLETKMKQLDYIGGALFDDEDIFTTKAGQEFTVKDLNTHSVRVTLPGRTPFSMGELIKYRSTNSLRNRGDVTMTKTELIAGVNQDRKVSVQWYTDGVVPRQTINGGNAADYLFQGFKPVSTEFLVPIRSQGSLDDSSSSNAKFTSGTNLRFLVNDLGLPGRDAARFMGGRCGFGKNKLFFLADPTKTTKPADVMTMLVDAFKGTLLEGIEIGFLSTAKDYVAAPRRASSPSTTAPTGPKPRGHMEVRVVKLHDKTFSEYQVIDPATFTGYYIRSASKDDMSYFRGLSGMLHALKTAKFFDAPDLPFIVRNDDDIALLKKRGAKLTHVHDIIPQSVYDAVQTELNALVKAQAETENCESHGVLNVISSLEGRKDLPESRFKTLVLQMRDAKRKLSTERFSAVCRVASYLNLRQADMLDTESFASKIEELYPMFSLVNSYNASAKLIKYIAMVDTLDAAEAAVAEAKAVMAASTVTAEERADVAMIPAQLLQAAE